MFSKMSHEHAIVALGCLACISSYAQTQVPAPTDASGIAEIVVTGSQFQSQVLSVPAERLSGDALLLRQSSSLGETVSGLAGVGSSYFGAAASRPVIRGLDGDRVRVMNNGAASNDASTLSSDHAVAESPLSSERIEVLRGAAALRYAGAVSGGVVNVLDNRIATSALFDAEGGRLGKVQIGVASNNQERTGAALIEAGTDKYALHVDGFTTRAGEMRVPNSRGLIPNSQADARGGAVGGSLFFDHGYLGASLQSTRQHYGSPAEDAVTIQMQSSRARIEGERRNLAGKDGLLGGLVDTLSGYVTSSDYQHQELDAGVVGTTFKSKGADAKLEVKLAKLPSVRIGWQREQTRFVADGAEAFVPKSLSQNQALYVLHERVGEQGALSAAWRGVHARVDSLGSETAARFVAAQRSFAAQSVAVNGQLNLAGTTSQGLAKGLAMTGGASRGARVPKDYELYADGEHVATKAYEMGNANLGVETSTHLELGLQWTGEKTSARPADSVALTVFTTRYDNFIYAAPTGGVSLEGNPIFQYASVPAQFRGWEWTGSKRLDASVDVAARLSNVTATNLASQEPLPRIAPLRMGVDVTSRQTAWGIPLQLKLGADHSAAQTHLAAGQVPTASYTLLNLAATLEHKSSLGRTLWFAKLDNASNALAYPATSILTQTAPGRVPLPGRNLKLGMQLSF